MDEAIVLDAHHLMMRNVRLCREIAKCFDQMAQMGVNPYYDLPNYGSAYFANDFRARADEMERDANKWLEDNL